MGRALKFLSQSQNAHVNLFDKSAQTPSTGDPHEIWFTCKRGDLLAALQSWHATLRALTNTPVFFLQNGLGLADELEPMGLRNWTRVACWWGARIENQTLQLTPPPRQMCFAGEADPEFWRACGFEVETLPQTAKTSLEWRKALTNLTLNGLLTLHGLPNGALLNKPDLLNQARELHLEARLLAETLGETLTPLEQTWNEVLLTAQNTPKNRNSLLQDLESKRPWELPWLNEWLLKKAAPLRLPLPHHSKLVQALHNLG
jgi:ketopantoate reductase